MTAITTKNFKSQLASLVKSTTTQRDKLQSIIEFGIAKYGENGDTTYLTMAMRAVVGVRAFRTETLKNYITSHANVTWAKAKDKNMVFKKRGKGDAEIKTLEKVWYEWDTKGEATPDLDVIARTKALMSALTKEGVHFKEGQEELAEILKGKIHEAMDEFAKAAMKA